MENNKKRYESPTADVIVLKTEYSDACLATGETGMPFDGNWNDGDDFGN